MATNGCLPGANGQFFHARRPICVLCFYTLHFCITFLHATAAPTQYRPLTGDTVLYGVIASSLHSDTITDMALCGPQTSYTDSFTDKFVHHVTTSYCCALQACQACTKFELADRWPENQPFINTSIPTDNTEVKPAGARRQYIRQAVACCVLLFDPLRRIH